MPYFGHSVSLNLIRELEPVASVGAGGLTNERLRPRRLSVPAGAPLYLYLFGILSSSQAGRP